MDIFIAFLRQRALKMKRRLTVVDFGCGDAKIARTLAANAGGKPKGGKGGGKGGGGTTVHSFDLVANNEHVTACNMAHVPLPKSVADVAVFCLSLMGTDTAQFLLEARRVLRAAMVASFGPDSVGV